MSLTDADVRAAEKQLPFALNVPNAETRAAMAEVDELMRQRRARFATAEELFDERCASMKPKKTAAKSVAEPSPDNRAGLLNPLKGSVLFEGDLISPVIDADEWHCVSSRAGFEPSARNVDAKTRKQ